MNKIQEVFKYIEDNITQEINYDDLAAIVGYSTFYFQRIFTNIFGLTVGEYIRNRRLTLALKDILETNLKISNVAYTYGFQTAEGFTKAFKKYHGYSPREMKNKRYIGNCQSMIEWETFEKLDIPYYTKHKLPSFTMQYKKKRLLDDDISFYDGVRQFWQQFLHSEDAKEMDNIRNTFVVKEAQYLAIDTKAMEKSNKYFYYGIGVETLNNSISKYETIIIPASTWLIFPCIGSVNTNLFKVWQKIYYYLLTTSNYQPTFDFNLEIYYKGDFQRSDYKCEIWIPIKDKGEI